MTEIYKIKCENVSKVYNLNINKKDKVLSFLLSRKLNKTTPFFALHDINFSVESGVSVGIIGLNGSGKTTLSNILGNVLEPTIGRIHSKGTPSLIAIGAGLNKEFTGLENIQYKCLMHGMSQKEINASLNDIIAFSELDDFIYQPLKSYSSGMRSRLGFSIAVHTNPDILIVDEALSVGDETFANKCILKMNELQNAGKTIFFVTHSITQVQKMCDKAMWIHYGKLMDYGDVNTVVKQYKDFVSEFKSLSKNDQLSYKKDMISSQQRLFKRKNEIAKRKTSRLSLATIVILLFTLLYMIKIQLGL
ncbi:ABC transporter ATP-binding protein [Mammaliicoccus lentus]|uniref:ABC transporter ATP-binding protein n=1 Tax=Mammaliicoccus lentus TaxID=42858 RepID=UPI002A5A045E|nr:ABC transporter ATP-binding protein [Mammaliicoccus lentus]WQL56001.1 ABC transporter ATP-binding protein [Mammaliicoccus lentus]